MWQADSILIGPGGIKGFMELGFLLYMEEKSLLDKCTAFVGVSVGAIISLLIVAGYSIYEIIDQASKTNLLEDINSTSLFEIQRVSGLISQKKIKENLEELIVAKFGKVLSMGELYLATGIELYLTSLRLHPTNPQPVHFSYQVNPEISCVEAAILSANIPIIFHRLYYQRDSYIDGALGDPYPIHLLDNGNRNVLGLYIQATFDQQDGFLTYLRQIFYASMLQLRNIRIQQASLRCRHVSLESNNLDPVGFSTNANDKITMVKEGYEVARKFFEIDKDHLVVSAANIEKIEGDFSSLR